MRVDVVSTRRFAAMLVAEARRRRWRTLSTRMAAPVTGWDRKYLVQWETGVREPSLSQALDYLEAVSR